VDPVPDPLLFFLVVPGIEPGPPDEEDELPHTFNKEKNLVREFVLCIYANKSSAVSSATCGYYSSNSNILNRDNAPHVLICCKTRAQHLGLHLMRYSTQMNLHSAPYRKQLHKTDNIR
jgi:hypothetical protein